MGAGAVRVSGGTDRGKSFSSIKPGIIKIFRAVSPRADYSQVSQAVLALFAPLIDGK